MSSPTTSRTPDTFKPILNKLLRTPEEFTPEDVRESLAHILVPGNATEVQIGAFLTGLNLHALDRHSSTLVAAAEFLRDRAVKMSVEGQDEDFVVDIVGTGGDGHNTFNVSTTAAIVAAGAGARVCKHGSRASTSSSGSADLLQSLNCLFTPPSIESPTPLPRIPFVFILAPHYHPSLASIAPFRKQLPVRTIFNILGPLINPARPKGMVVGVAHHSLGHTFARSLHQGGVKHALVVCGAEMLDEISIAGETYVWELKEDGSITEFMIHPRMFGLPTHPLSSVSGGNSTENASTFKMLLASGSNIPESLTPVLDFVLINAAALLTVAGIAKDYIHGVELARESIYSGKAWQALVAFRESGERSAVMLKQ